MNFKKSLLISLLSFGIAQPVFAETYQEKLDRAILFYEQENYSAAFPIMKQLAEQGLSDAQFNLAVMYFLGRGVAQSDKQAIYWYEKAAEQGHARAQFNLGTMYYRGSGVTQSYKQATYWFEKAAEQGEAEAQRNLGIMYEYGKGVRRDLSKAKHYYGLACDGGDNNGCKYYADLDKQGVR